MELKKAVAELRRHVVAWKGYSNSPFRHERFITLDTDCAIPVAETLLAALEGKEGGLSVRSYGHMVRTDAIFCPLCIAECHTPAAPPSHLAGRTVDGWGWKVFRVEDGGLRSQIIQDTKSEVVPLPEGTWLHYRDWQASQNTRDQAWHILKTEVDAKAWITKRKSDEGHRVIRRVAWQGLANTAPDNIWPSSFEGRIFTAEEIYILPEEGMPICPAPPAERPPEKRDWFDPILAAPSYRRPYPVRQVRPARDGGRGFEVSTNKEVGRFGWYAVREYRIVRRAADPLRVGDKVSFGSKEGWVFEIDTLFGRNTYSVNFTKYRVAPDQGDGWGAFYGEDLTLVEPVYDRPAEKGDC